MLRTRLSTISTTHSSLSLLSLFAVCSLLALGCNTKSHIGGDDTGVDGGGEACGSVTCDEGTVCCNASCGVCTAPGVACTTIACVDDGGVPPDTGGDSCGSTTCGSGEVCCNESCGICALPGEGCPLIFCDDAGPGLIPCSGFAGMDCPSGYYCDNVEATCRGEEPAYCQPIPTACPADCPGVCGCDGNVYCNECDAASAGQDSVPGPCSVTPNCAPLDAHGEGFCDAWFGVTWTGDACVGVSGCSCVGTDCDRLYRDLESCERAHLTCPPAPVPGCGGEAGLRCAADEYCDYPPGSFCGGDDSLGSCRPRPEDCTEEYAPVCGCDGMTYGNACSAHAVGMDFISIGECPPVP